MRAFGMKRHSLNEMKRSPNHSRRTAVSCNGERAKCGMKSIDLKAAIPPISLLMALSTFRELKPGEGIEVLVTDPDMARDLSLIVERSGDLAIEDVREGEDFRIRVRKL